MCLTIGPLRVQYRCFNVFWRRAAAFYTSLQLFDLSSLKAYLLYMFVIDAYFILFFVCDPTLTNL